MVFLLIYSVCIRDIGSKPLTCAEELVAGCFLSPALSFEPCSDIAEFGSDIAEDKNLLEDNTWILPKFGLLGTLLLCFMAKWSLVSTQ